MRIFVLLLLIINLSFCNAEKNIKQEPNLNITNIENIEVYDPLLGYNRVMTAINGVFYDYVMYPISYSYDYVMPDPIQGAFSNFFDNLLYPVRLINNLLQGKFENSWHETKRFLLNTTIGFAGLSDVATLHFDMPKYNEDFGQTLGVWGVSEGPYIVWPILGPSNLRDTFGLVGDYFVDPLNYIDEEKTAYGVKIGKAINEDSLNPGALSKEAKSKKDPYIFIRNSYTLKRKYQISE